MIKIIKGRFKGKNLLDVTGIRATEGRVREAVFNILYSQNVPERMICADLCCGTGSMTFEALSRGAKKVILMDNNAEIIEKMEQNIQNLGISENEITLINGDARQNLNENLLGEAEVLFVDPPYDVKILQPILENLDKFLQNKSNKLIFVETNKKNAIDDLKFNNLKLIDKKIYGNILLYLFQT